MRNIFRTIILLIIITFYGNSNAFAQACGQGLFFFEIYTLDGEKENDINYEVFPINKDSLKSIYREEILDQFNYNAYNGTIIQSEEAIRIIDTTEIGRKELNQVIKLNMHKNDRVTSGKFKNGQILFHTYETYRPLFLLKVSSKNKEVYILANVYGGCDRTSIIIWNDRPQIVIKK